MRMRLPVSFTRKIFRNQYFNRFSWHMAVAKRCFVSTDEKHKRNRRVISIVDSGSVVSGLNWKTNCSTRFEEIYVFYFKRNRQTYPFAKIRYSIEGPKYLSRTFAWTFIISVWERVFLTVICNSQSLCTLMKRCLVCYI